MSKANPAFVTFSNSAEITIPDSGAALASPSTISVNGVTGTVSSLRVTIEGLTHTWPDDLDIVLVGPSGADVLLMSDIGGNTDVTNVTFSLTDSALNTLPDQGPLSPGLYRPSNVGARDKFDDLTTLSGNTSLAVFDGRTPNGTWNLYVTDDGKGDGGKIALWSITFPPQVPTINAPIPMLTSNAPSAAELVDGADETAAPAPAVTLAGFETNGCARIISRGLPSQKYRLEGSSNLQTWTIVGNNSSDEVEIAWTDCESTGAARFYRLAEDW